MSIRINDLTVRFKNKIGAAGSGFLNINAVIVQTQHIIKRFGTIQIREFTQKSIGVTGKGGGFIENGTKKLPVVI